MTQEEKELLLKDITARLSYGLKVQIDFGEHCIKYGIDRYVDDTVICVWPETFEIGVNDEDQACDIEDVRPYLRPLSSMTEEEKEELRQEHIKDEKLFAECLTKEANGDSSMRGKVVPHFAADWCNKNHFDYRGLIPMGLALEAPEGMYDTKTE